MHKIIKRILNWLTFLTVSPLVLIAWLEKNFSQSEFFFETFAHILSLLPGKIGSYFRVGFYKGTLESCSWDAMIGFGTFFSHRKAVLGKNISIGAYCIIGTAIIEDDVMIASRVSIPSGKRQHLTEQNEITKNLYLSIVRIGRGSWIGEGAIVMANVDNCSIVGAGKIITKKIINSTAVKNKHS